MDATTQLLIIGGGNMGEAILAGLLANDAWDKKAVSVANPGAERRAYLQKTYGVACVADAAEAPASHVVMLCAKPQVLPEIVADGVARGVYDQARLVISIAAGITCAKLESLLPDSMPVIRVMPNLGLKVGQGCSGLSAGTYATEEHVQAATAIFAASGQVVVVDEDLQSAVTAVSGSGPAYFAAFVDALAQSGVAQGLSKEQAYELALQTLVGTAEILRTRQQSAAQLVKSVSSPGGTTVAALDAFAAGGFNRVIAAGVAAAAQRAEELKR